MTDRLAESRPASHGDETAPSAGKAVYHGAGRDLGRVITTHLFGITMNHAGSTLLMRAVGACRAVWSLPSEGQFALGYAGPELERGRLTGALKIWASRARWRGALSDPDAYDWARIRAAWYFQARARDPAAPVFFTKSPPHLLVVDELARHFPNPRFLFLVRNPYAVCEGICRFRETSGRGPFDGSLPEVAARHTVMCLDYQRRNVAAQRDRGVFFTYERMCAEPERVAEMVRGLVPEVDDLDLRRPRRIKGRYHETLRDMNAQQIARLKPDRIAAFNRVFRPRRDLLDYFGYEMLPDC